MVRPGGAYAKVGEQHTTTITYLRALKLQRESALQKPLKETEYNIRPHTRQSQRNAGNL